MKLVLRSLAIAAALSVPMVAVANASFIGGFKTVKTIQTTVPPNGDLNPYGVVVVPASSGKLIKGNILVSNFNNNNGGAGQQGTGTTIVEISPKESNPNATPTVFAQVSLTANQTCPGGVGLTTALTIVQNRWVIVGSLPTSDGTAATVQPGCLIVLNNQGAVVTTFSGGEINGPWDMTSVEHGNSASLFVTNVLNGITDSTPIGTVVNKGTVLRIDLSFSGGSPTEKKRTIIASGFPEKTDPNALVIGPTGVGLGSHDTLYVADTVDNSIVAISKASSRKDSDGVGKTISSNGGLNGPLGLAIAPNSDILTVNSADGNLVETTPAGHQFPPATLDNTPVSGSSNGAGSLFGLAVAPKKAGIYFVDDIANTLNIFE